MKWDWTPGVGCGEFRFAQPFRVDDYFPKVVQLERACESADWDTYRVGAEEARLRVECGVLTAIECVKSLLFRGVEVIGVAENELQLVLGIEPLTIKSWEDGSAMLEVAELGLTLWIENGHVESATVEAICIPDVV